MFWVPLLGFWGVPAATPWTSMGRPDVPKPWVPPHGFWGHSKEFRDPQWISEVPHGVLGYLEVRQQPRERHVQPLDHVGQRDQLAAPERILGGSSGDFGEFRGIPAGFWGSWGSFLGVTSWPAAPRCSPGWGRWGSVGNGAGSVWVWPGGAWPDGRGLAGRGRTGVAGRARPHLEQPGQPVDAVPDGHVQGLAQDPVPAPGIRDHLRATPCRGTAAISQRYHGDTAAIPRRYQPIPADIAAISRRYRGDIGRYRSPPPLTARSLAPRRRRRGDTWVLPPLT